jgi:zinc protease
MKKLFKYSTITYLLFLSFSVTAQTPTLQALPMDPKVKYGKLPNGLTYYIRANKLPKERADFYIVQNVGAILENDNQNGLAHFLEHMAFNGTKHYPGKGILNYFEKIGVKFGTNINAYTGLDETVYMLKDVPTYRSGIIDSALLVLHDWSNCLLLEGSEIDAERGVIREEWRTRNSGESRMWKESNKLKYPNSQYAKRDVIGDTAIINNFAYQTLRDYYAQWYRPDQQAVVIVGDFDAAKIEANLKSTFSDIPKKENPSERIVYTIQDNDQPIIAIVKDKEARTTRIELEYKHDKMPTEVRLSMNGYTTHVINSLISIILDERFEEICQQADAPFVRGGGEYGELIKSKDAFQMMAIPKVGQELKGLDALLLEAEKIKRFGFTNAELERAKASLTKQIENAYNERDNQKNGIYIREYMENFLNQETMPGIEWEYQTIKMILPQINLEMVNQLAKSYVTDKNLIVSVMAPDKVDVKIPTAEQITQAIDAAKKAELKPKAEESINKPLLSKIPSAGKINKISKNESLGTTEWLLSNGVKVVFKTTDFKKDEIILTAFSQGGISKIQNISDLPSAELAAKIVEANGLGNYSDMELKKILSGKIASAGTGIDEYTEKAWGNASTSDLETMLQLLYLKFTAPRQDDNAFGALMNQYKTLLANAETDPRKTFSDSVDMVTTSHHQRTLLLNLKTLEKLNQTKALEIYKQRFANPADFTFIFVGNIDPNDEAIKKLICTYIGGFKTSSTTETFTDNNIRTPKGKVSNNFTKEMQVKKASNYVSYTAPLAYNVKNNVIAKATANILNIRYIESIREKEGGSYGVGVKCSVSDKPVQQIQLIMVFDCDPEKQTKLMSILHSEVAEIVAHGPRADDFQKVKENLLKQYTQDLAENSWWKSILNSYYIDGLNYVTDYKKSVEELTPDMIQSTLKEIVAAGNVLEVVMKPKE